MAEYGAHLTSTANKTEDEAGRPDIFVALAQENLMSSLKPAVTHMLRILAETNPVRYGWLYRCGDEVYSLLDLVLTHYYLNHYKGSFAENFYGLKRVPAKDASAKLQQSQKIKSILFLVLLPYIKQKCDSKYESMKQQPIRNDGTGQELRKQIQSVFVKVYPCIHVLYEGILLCCHLTYALGKLRYHTPWLPLAGVNLEYLSEEDLLAQEAMKPSLDLANRSFAGKCIALARYGVGSVSLGLSSAVSVGVFFLQFLEWWYASDQHSKYITSLPNPSPPKLPASDLKTNSPSLCPVCLRTRTNDTALAVSGYVFCYPCIYRFVAKNGRCPVTGYPANVDHVVRLYVTQSF